MDIHGSGVLNWRNLDLKEDIHYCDQNDDRSNVYKKHGRWAVFKEEGCEIKFCPYCGIELSTIKEDRE